LKPILISGTDPNPARRKVEPGFRRVKLMDKLALQRRAELIRYAYKREVFNRGETHPEEMSELPVSILKPGQFSLPESGFQS
jgi:hypothetical protein